MRRAIAYSMVAVGLAVMVVSYFFLSAPWGFPPSSVEYSNPVVPYAPAIFIVGFLLTFLAAVVYEVLPEKRGE